MLEGILHATRRESNHQPHPDMIPESCHSNLSARYTHCYNTSINVPGVASHIFIRFKACFMRWNPCLALLMRSGTRDKTGHGPGGSLDEHSKKMTADVITVDQCITEPSLENFFQEMEINSETNWTLCIE